jgi:hypothetical protein
MKSALGLTILLLLVEGCSSTAGPAASSPSSPSSAPASCTLTSVVDSYDGFHIGVPDGWNVFTLDGMIIVSKDPASTEAAVVRPALLTAGLAPATYFATALEKLKQHLALAGMTMTSTLSGVSQMPTATLNLRSPQGPLTGQARVAIVPYRTAHGASIVVLIASWARASQFATESTLLAGIGTCYGAQTGTLYQVVRDQVFTYSIPTGWQARNETQDTIDMYL